MNLNDCLNWIIDDGIEAARADYARPDQRLKLEGSIRGFEDCRGKSPSQIAELLAEAGHTIIKKHAEQAADYWYWACRRAEIEWVANVLSNVMAAQGWRPIGMMTARGAIKAAEIIGAAAQ
jgi:hypothetical protein